jgi:hypothetical protein
LSSLSSHSGALTSSVAAPLDMPHRQIPWRQAPAGSRPTPPGAWCCFGSLTIGFVLRTTACHRYIFADLLMIQEHG